MNFFTPAPDPVDRLREDAGHLLVCRAVNRSDWISEALLDIAAGKQTHWTPQEWDVLLADVRATRLHIADWLDLNT